MKTLLVSYTPRMDRSSTKVLLDTFRSQITNSQIEELDLCKDVPPLFLPDSISAYIHRDYMSEKLSPKDQALLSTQDRMTSQLKGADIVVIAYPMHNFSFPAVVKAWFDAVILKGQTWDIKDSKFVGLMTGKRALVLCSSGGIYDQSPMNSFEHAVSAGICEFQFMGYSEVKAVFAQGMNVNDSIKAANLEKCREQIRGICAEWYR